MLYFIGVGWNRQIPFFTYIFTLFVPSGMEWNRMEYSLLFRQVCVIKCRLLLYPSHGRVRTMTELQVFPGGGESSKEWRFSPNGGGWVPKYEVHCDPNPNRGSKYWYLFSRGFMRQPNVHLLLHIYAVDSVFLSTHGTSVCSVRAVEPSPAACSVCVNRLLLIFSRVGQLYPPSC